MAEALTVSRPVADKMTTFGGAFGTGIILGWVASTRPAWAAGLSLAAAAGGAIGALTTKGFLAELSEGLGAAAMGALGASLPTMFARGAGAKTKALATQQPGVKQLPAPTNIVAEAIAQQVRSAVEI